MKRFLAGLLCAWAAAAGAATNEPVDYRRLDYAEERFVLAGAPFTGLAIQTNRAGKLVAKRSFKDGRYHGLTEEFYTNGVLSVRAEFADGERHGTNTYWNMDGSLLKSQRWEHGRLVDSTHKEDLP